MKAKMKIYLLCFAIGLALGLILSFFHNRSSNSKLPSPATIKKVEVLQENVEKAEYGYNQSLDSLRQQSTRLVRELTQSQSALESSKQKVHALQIKVFDFLDKRFELKQAADSTITPDSDSLTEIVPTLLAASIANDSLYEKAVVNLTSQVAVQDSVISLKDSLYSVLRQSFDKSISEQQEWEQQIAFLSGQLKRKKIKSKIVSAALFIVSGAFVKTLLHK